MTSEQGLQNLLDKAKAKQKELQALNNEQSTKFFKLHERKEKLTEETQFKMDKLLGRVEALDESVAAGEMSQQERDERARDINMKIDVARLDSANEEQQITRDIQAIQAEVNEKTRVLMRKVEGKVEMYEEMLAEVRAETKALADAAAAKTPSPVLTEPASPPPSPPGTDPAPA